MGREDDLGDARLRRARDRLSLLTVPETELGRRLALLGVLALTALALVLNHYVGSVAFPSLTLVVPMVFGGLLLEPPPLMVAIASGFGALIIENLGWSKSAIRPGSYVVLGIVAAIALKQSFDRRRLGLSAGRGEAMLLELRDRLRLQGELPRLLSGWHAEVEQHQAGGSSFGGDFLLATLTDSGRTMELVLVDVSGKGVEAGTRALMLSGALGGLLGAVPPTRFLQAANDYLIRQEWGEGFATAIHLTIDLGSGRYRITNAGHPPAVHYSGGTGVWRPVEPPGMVLGVLEDAEFGWFDGELRPYDALLLYTDGLVEVPGRDLSVGIDRLLGAAERLIPRGFDGGAQRLLEDAANASDDRALVLLWRS